MLMLHYKGNRIPFPELKSFQIPLGAKPKDGERSSENGLNPLKLPSFQLDKTITSSRAESFKNSIYSRFRNHYFFSLKSKYTKFDFLKINFKESKF
jgi:hypothetical protein